MTIEVERDIGGPGRTVVPNPMVRDPMVRDPQPSGPLVLTTPAVLKERLDTYSQCRRILLDWIDTNLKPDKDYHLLHAKIGPRGMKKDCPNKDDRLSKGCDQCHAKAGLSKAGSEKIAGMLRLRPKFRRDEETWAMLGGPHGTICLVCELEDEHGQIVGEGRGCRTKDQDFGDVNKAIKMAQKAAQTDAIMRFGGLSEIFTQDEDTAKGQSRARKAPKAAETKASERTPAGPTIGQDEIAILDTLLKDIGRPEKKLMRDVVGYGERLEDIRVADYARVKAELEARRQIILGAQNDNPPHDA